MDNNESKDENVKAVEQAARVYAAKNMTDSLDERRLKNAFMAGAVYAIQEAQKIVRETGAYYRERY